MSTYKNSVLARPFCIRQKNRYEQWTWHKNYIHIYIPYKYLFLLASSIFVKSDNWFGSPGIQKIGLLSEIVELKEN